MPIRKEDYPPNWRELSLRIREERAGNKCEWCGVANGDPHPDTGSKVVLSVAHLDHDTTNNREENLAALCQRCHLNYDRSRNIRIRKYGRHYRRLQLDLFDMRHNAMVLLRLLGISNNK